MGLRNWPALGFWIRLGYDRITGLSGDRQFGEGKYAVIELEKRLLGL